MTIRHELVVSRKALERLPLELRVVASNVVEYRGFQYEECPVDPAFAGLRLLAESQDTVAFELHVPEPGGWPHCGDGCDLAVPS